MIFFLFFLIFFSAFLSGSETALFSLPQLTIKSYRNSTGRLKMIAQMMQRPRDVLVTILILNIFANILIQNTFSMIFEGKVGVLFNIIIPLLLTLFIGELFPKSFALTNHTKIAYYCGPIIYFAAKFLRYIRDPLSKLTSFISRVLFFFMKEEKEISTQELKMVLKNSEERGILMPIESELIGGSLDLQQTQVREHMRPREEIIYFDLQEPIERLVEIFSEKKISRIPICSDKDLEKIIGILFLKDFFFHQRKIEKGSDLIPYLHKPYFVPESTRGWTTLRNLRERETDLAIVVDQYGSICGLITQEDLVETVIGDIVDPRDTHSLYTRSSDDVIIASGKLELCDFEEIFGISLDPVENVVTLGGWLTEQLGQIPSAGTKYATDKFFFYVLSAKPNRIRRIYVRRVKK